MINVKQISLIVLIIGIFLFIVSFFLDCKISSESSRFITDIKQSLCDMRYTVIKISGILVIVSVITLFFYYKINKD